MIWAIAQGIVFIYILVPSNIIWHCIQYCSDYGKTKVKVCTHKGYPISRPHTWVMGCLSWVFAIPDKTTSNEYGSFWSDILISLLEPIGWAHTQNDPGKGKCRIQIIFVWNAFMRVFCIKLTVFCFNCICIKQFEIWSISRENLPWFYILQQMKSWRQPGKS